MSLNDVVKNSNYVTDEDLTADNILGMANTAMGEVNGECGTKLPFFTSENVATSTYKALPDTWISRLIEPYLSYSIAANDGDTNNRDFHYNRFLKALSQFKENGLGDILEKDPDTGEDTGYAGDSGNYKKIDVSEVTMHWKGWL